VWSGDGAGATWQHVRRREGSGVAGDDGAMGALLRGMCGGSAHGGGDTCVGAHVSGGAYDPDVCGLWLQECLPLCLVLTFSVLFYFSYLL
jgi:hypothetical protein